MNLALESATTIIVDRSNRNDSVGSNWRCQELIPGHLELCDAISLLLQIVTFCFGKLHVKSQYSS